MGAPVSFPTGCEDSDFSRAAVQRGCYRCSSLDYTQVSSSVSGAPGYPGYLLLQRALGILEVVRATCQSWSDLCDNHG